MIATILAVGVLAIFSVFILMLIIDGHLFDVLLIASLLAIVIISVLHLLILNGYMK